MKLDLNTRSLRSKLEKIYKLLFVRIVFIAILIVLSVYLIMVWHISGLATAEPTAEEVNTAVLTSNRIPKIDKEVIQKIESLEEHNTEIRSLFNKARNNPFQE